MIQEYIATTYENIELKNIVLNKNSHFINCYISTNQGLILNVNTTELDNIHLMEEIKIADKTEPITQLLKSPDSNYLLALTSPSQKYSNIYIVDIKTQEKTVSYKYF